MIQLSRLNFVKQQIETHIVSQLIKEILDLRVKHNICKSNLTNLT